MSLVKNKSMSGALAAALIAATALTAASVIAPTLPVQAETTVTFAPASGFSELAKTVMPSVVSVQVKFANTAAEGDGPMPMIPGIPPDSPFFEFFKNRPDGQQPMRPPRGGMAQGSGFFISNDGYIVTNNHVVQNANEVSVTMQDGTEYRAKVIGTDAKTDLALIKVDADRSFRFVNFAGKKPLVGDWVMAVGNPFGLGGTVTTGIVSAEGRDIGSGPYDDFLQIDASINHGNSGGPAFNLEGEVVGVNTAIFSPSGGSVGIGFAIPAAMAEDVIASLRSEGAVTRGWLGIQIQPVTADIAESMGLKEAKGAIISDVTAASPALKGGMKTGDTILSLDGTEIDDARDLSKKVARVKPGQTVDVVIIRDGKQETLKIEIGKMPGQQAMAAPAVEAPAKTDLAQLGLRLESAGDGAGVKVVDVDPEGAAAQRGIRPGDTILEVAGIDVQSPADVKAALKTAKANALLLVKSGEGQRFVAVPLDQG
jgi:serine protease Do